MDPLVYLRELWLPTLLAAVICYVAGVVLYMLLPLHRSDWTGMPGEEGVLEAMRKAGVGAGQYRFPWCDDMRDMKSPEYQRKLSAGPAGILVVRPPGKFAMGAMLVQMVLYHLVVTGFVAYLASRTLERGADYLAVFRVTGTAAIMAYAFGQIPQTIWYRYKWSFTFRTIGDGVLWGLLTAGVFGWLWPR